MHPEDDVFRSDGRFRFAHSGLRGLTSDSWGIELAVRALAGSRAPLLPSPNGMRIDHSQYLAYWHALHFLAVARLGWRDPGLGFRSWHELGRPSGDATLDLIASIWGRDGSLDVYMAWATLNHASFASGGPESDDATPSASWMRWARETRDLPNLELLTGGSNMPHLGDAAAETDSIRDDYPPILTIVDSAHRRAIYVTGDRGFYDDLSVRWSDLPEVAPNNWHVEVFNRQLGYLGEYCKSRVTGRLYSGKHSVHMLGG